MSTILGSHIYINKKQNVQPNLVCILAKTQSSHYSIQNFWHCLPPLVKLKAQKIIYQPCLANHLQTCNMICSHFQQLQNFCCRYLLLEELRPQLQVMDISSRSWYLWNLVENQLTLREKSSCNLGWPKHMVALPLLEHWVPPKDYMSAQRHGLRRGNIKWVVYCISLITWRDRPHGGVWDMLTRVFKIESCLLSVLNDGNVICSSSFL